MYEHFNFYSVKDTVKRVFATYIANTGLLTKIYKDLSEVND